MLDATEDLKGSTITQFTTYLTKSGRQEILDHTNPITEENLLPLLQDFEVFAKTHEPDGTPSEEPEEITEDALFSAEKFSTSTVSTLLDEYIIDVIDYTNYYKYFLPGDETVDDVDGDVEYESNNFIVARAEDTPNTPDDELLQKLENDRERLVDDYYAQEVVDLAIMQGPQDININLLLNSFYTSPSLLSKGLVGGLPSTYVSTLIGLGTAVILIAIIVSILYRVPGVFFGLSFIATAVLTVTSYFGMTFEFGVNTIFGLVAGSVVSLFASAMIIKKIRDIFASGSSIKYAVTTGYININRNVLDVYIVGILIGITFTFFSTNVNQEFGITLMVYTFIGYLLNYVLVFILNYFLSNNITNRFRFLFFSKKDIELNDTNKTTATIVATETKLDLLMNKILKFRLINYKVFIY